jgi:hypothetical protein
MTVLAAAAGSPRHKKAQDRVRSLRQRTTQQIEERVRRGMREGDVPPHVSAAVAATFVTTVLSGLSLLARDCHSRQRMIDVADCAMEFWDALLGHE